jgi:hypothetical protein
MEDKEQSLHNNQYKKTKKVIARRDWVANEINSKKQA